MNAIKRYRKKSSYDPPLARRPRAGWMYITYLLSSLFLLIGGMLLAFQFFSPYFSLASQSSYVKPVGDDYFSLLQEKRAGFSFAELGGAFLNTEGSEINAPSEFSLNIPRLGIDGAKVETWSQSLAPDTKLGHLIGSSLPGKTGRAVIYGHSSSPLLFAPDNYRTIFSTLDKLKDGDAVKISYRDQTFTYIVKSMEVVKPEDVVEALSTSPQKILTLVTCFPFGSTDKRLLIHTQLTY